MRNINLAVWLCQHTSEIGVGKQLPAGVARLKSALDVVGVENFVSDVAAGLFEVFVVKLLNSEVLVGLTKRHLAVCVVKDGGAFFLEVDRCLGSCALNGLTTTVDTTAGTSHDFDKICLDFSCFYLGEKFFCVLGAGGNSNVNFYVTELVGCGLDGSGTANVVEFELFELGTEDNFSSGTESCFHNTAGSTEDRACTGTDVEGLVEFFVVESLVVDACLFDHTAELASGDRVVNVVNAFADSALSGTAYFKLLSGTRNCGNEYDVCGIETALTRIVGLVHCAEHLLRRFAGGKIVGEFGEVVFAVFDPTGRAGGDEGEVLAFLHSFKEFGSFFHDGKVCGEVHVVNAVEAHALESGNHLAFGINAGFNAEAFAEGCTDGRSGADRNVLGGIVDRIPNLCGVVLFVESAYGTSNDTLTAGYAGGGSERIFVCTADDGIKATVESFDNTDALHVLTSSYATAAEDTFVVVTNEEGGAFVLYVGDVLACETVFVFNAEVAAELLQFTAAAADAGETFFFVSGENEFKVGLSGSHNLGGVRSDFHAVRYFGNASSHETSCALDFNETETASADFVDVLEIAESGNIDLRDSGSVDDLAACGNFIIATVNFYSNHIHECGVLLRLIKL